MTDMTAPAAPVAPNSTSTLSLSSATWLLAKLNLKLLFRGNLWWILAACGVLPVLLARISQTRHAAETAVASAITLLSIFTPLLVAGSVGEEVEKKTYAYLWSRPIPRTSFILGKLLAYAPYLFAVFFLSVLASTNMAASRGGDAPALAPLACGGAVAALMLSVACALVATITPKHATGFSLFYLLFVDNVIGGIPTSIRYLSLQFQARTVMGVHEDSIVPITTSLPTSLTVGGVMLLVFWYFIVRRSQKLE